MIFVYCDLCICNYLDNKTHITHWRDVDNKALIKKAEELRKILLTMTPNIEIIYEDYVDANFGGRKFYTATIVIH